MNDAQSTGRRIDAPKHAALAFAVAVCLAGGCRSGIFDNEDPRWRVPEKTLREIERIDPAAESNAPPVTLDEAAKRTLDEIAAPARSTDAVEVSLADVRSAALANNLELRTMLIDPAIARANLSAILEGAKSKGLPVFLVGMEAPGNYGAEYKAAFDAIYADLAAGFGATLYPFFFQGMTEGNPDPAAMRPFMLDDGIHPNAEGVAKIVADLGPAVQAFLASQTP